MNENNNARPINKPEVVRLFQAKKDIDSIPELDKLKKTIENTSWHHQLDVYTHVQEVLANMDNILEKVNSNILNLLNKKIEKLTRGELLWWATLLHDIAKPETFTKDNVRTYTLNHEIEGSKLSRTVLTRLKIDQEEIDYIGNIIASHSILHYMLGPDFTEEKFNQFCSEHTDALEITLLAYADTVGSDLSESKPNDYKNRIEIYENKISNWKSDNN